MHNGTLIIQNASIPAAGSHLPSTSRPELVDKALGSRHKAALGMSENSDAIIIVVSEETSVISMAEKRSLTRGLSVDTLKTMLFERLMPGIAPEGKAEQSEGASSPDNSASREQNSQDGKENS